MTARHASLREWQAYVLRSRTAHLYRIASDAKGGWIVTRPGSKERLHFPYGGSPGAGTADEGEAMQDAPSRDAQAKTPAAMTPAEKHAADVRGSYPDLSV